MKHKTAIFITIFSGAAAIWGLAAATLDDQPAAISGWARGKGWGWIWGKDDEAGSLNALTDSTRLATFRRIEKGKIYDLGVAYDRESYKWPGHSPGEIITFRSPEGVQRQGDKPQGHKNPSKSAWHSCALFISDNVATQIDGLGHVTMGADNHWYNGFKEADFGGDFGIRRCDATTIPPIAVQAVLIDVAGQKGLEQLPPHTAITPADLKAALEWEKEDLHPGEAVFIRTGALRHWGENGSNHQVLGGYDSAGINLESAKWLVEEKGAVLIGADTSGLEVAPADPEASSFMPAHLYLLIEQGVHIGEFHYLEDLARDKVYRFTYICLVNKIRGAVAGFTLRPIAVR
ncbi:MAG: cyclase family protein [Planctomycetes bacterium]|nr:cyclase family protein [Planctomycetota bacterium]